MRKRGLMIAELVAASGILVLAVMITWFGMDLYAQVRDEIDLRRSLRLVADAELARIAAGAPPAGVSGDAAAPWRVQVNRSPVTGAWGDLRVTTVSVSGVSRRGRIVAVELSAILPDGGVGP